QYNTRARLPNPLLKPGRRLLVCLAAFALAFIASRPFADEIFGLLFQPLLRAGQGSVDYTKMFEAFFVRDKVAILSAVMVSLPITAAQLWYFIGSARFDREERHARLPFSVATLLLFVSGVALSYFVAIPMMLHLLLGSPIANGEVQHMLPAVGKYLVFSTKFLFAFGIAFMLPVLLMLLEHAEVVNRRQLIERRRNAIVGAFVAALVMSPPDAGSLLVVAITLILLYEAAIVGIRFVEHRRARIGQSAATG
ncbi:MAG: twin-arginine translocase subunit TatC, partial [Cytophagaceae bacterium]